MLTFICIGIILVGSYRIVILLTTTEVTDEQILSQLQDWKTLEKARESVHNHLWKGGNRKSISRAKFLRSFERLLAEEKIMQRKIFIGPSLDSGDAKTRMEYKAFPSN